jgi:hypothetical protein
MHFKAQGVAKNDEEAVMYHTSYLMSNLTAGFEDRSLKPFTISHIATVIWIGSNGIAISPIERYPSSIINVTPMN